MGEALSSPATEFMMNDRRHHVLLPVQQRGRAANLRRDVRVQRT
jgi:hypothetical protein